MTAPGSPPSVGSDASRASNAADVPLIVSVTGPVRRIHRALPYSLTSPRAKIEATKLSTSVEQISQ